MFLRSVGYPDNVRAIHGEGVVLRLPVMADYDAWVRLRIESRTFLEPWEPLWHQDDLSRSAFRQRVRRYQRDTREDAAYPFLVIQAETEELLGALTLSNVRRGVSQSGSLGYWIGRPHARRGYMAAAVKAFIPFAFETLRLHRLEAACLPINEASIRLLRRCGFTQEGYARRYLKIGGVWQDHLLFALLDSDPWR